jgi:hypothetical protein
VRELHEHRRCVWSVSQDVFLYELGAQDLQLLNEIRAAYKLPLLVFDQTPVPSPGPAVVPSVLTTPE